jgi:hypothetical protein
MGPIASDLFKIVRIADASLAVQKADLSQSAQNDPRRA